MGITDRVGKRELFEIITGEKPYQDIYATPQFDVPDEKIDEIYLQVMKMWRCYFREVDYPIEKYYREDFKRIHTAYLEGDKEKFKAGLEELLVSINME